jgi:hypothetical protein
VIPALETPFITISGQAIHQTLRRLSLTAILSVIARGTSTSKQSILSVLMSIAFVKLYAFYAPYSDDIDAEVGQYQILFTFFGAMVIQGELVQPDEVNNVGICLVCANLMVIIFPCWFYFRKYESERTSKSKVSEQGEGGRWPATSPAER